VHACVLQKELREDFPGGTARLAKYESSMPTVLNLDVKNLESINPATHVYLAWQGFDEPSRRAVAKLFKTSTTAECVTVVQYCCGNNIISKEDQMTQTMAELGFGRLQILGERFPVKLVGGHQMSGFTFTKLGSQRHSQNDSRTGLLDLKPFPSGEANCVAVAQLHNTRSKYT